MLNGLHLAFCCLRSLLGAVSSLLIYWIRQGQSGDKGDLRSMGKQTTLTETDKTAVKVGKDAVRDMHILRLRVLQQHYWTDDDLEQFSEDLHDVMAALEIATQWIGNGLDNGGRK